MATLSVKPRISIKDANNELILNVKTIKRLASFPFGDELYQLWKKKSYGFTGHGRAVINNMNLLLGPNPETIIEDGITPATKNRIRKTQSEVFKSLINDNDNEEVKLFFRLAALYHDIGKYIIKERHPTIGRYTLEYLDPVEKTPCLCFLKTMETGCNY